jgi:ribosome biogenesis GTPase
VKKQISDKLRASLGDMDQAQIDHLIARAIQARYRAKDRSPNLDPWVTRVLKKDQQDQELAKDPIEETANGVVDARLGGHSTVVGDQAVVASVGENDFVLVEVKPRATSLYRADVSKPNGQQVIVANVDVIVIVVSVVTPPLHPRLIDRYLVAIQQGGASPLIYVNKIDLLEDPKELDQLDVYKAIGVPVVIGSAKAHADDLRALLVGKTCAFVGHSGVGKSSIVNALMPEAALETGEVSKGYGRGTHTTTTSSLHRLQDGTVLIDTPGIRSFGLHKLKKEEVADYFPEFDDLICKFTDCAHTVEPGCAVRAEVEAGRIARERYNVFLRLLDEAK